MFIDRASFICSARAAPSFFVLLPTNPGAKIHRSLARNIPEQILCEIPRTNANRYKKLLLGVASTLVQYDSGHNKSRREYDHEDC